MVKDIKEETKQSMKRNCKPDMNHGGNAVYGLGLLGAIIYYIQEASNFGEGIVGILKAIVWPAFMVYDLLKFLAG